MAYQLTFSLSSKRLLGCRKVFVPVLELTLSRRLTLGSKRYSKYWKRLRLKNSSSTIGLERPI